MDNPYAHVPVPYARHVHWDRLFEDLEGQLAAEWESERAALDAEAERLRIAGLELRGRLRAFAASDGIVRIGIRGGLQVTGRVDRIGADWLAVDDRSVSIIPLAAVLSLQTDHGALLRSLTDHADEPDAAAGLRERMTFGFVLRDLARRRVPVRVDASGGEPLYGTIDRAGADHLDLAEHEPGTVRRAAHVRVFRLLPFHAVSRVSVSTDGPRLR